MPEFQGGEAQVWDAVAFRWGGLRRLWCGYRRKCRCPHCNAEVGKPRAKAPFGAAVDSGLKPTSPPEFRGIKFVSTPGVAGGEAYFLRRSFRG